MVKILVTRDGVMTAEVTLLWWHDRRDQDHAPALAGPAPEAEPCRRPRPPVAARADDTVHRAGPGLGRGPGQAGRHPGRPRGSPVMTAARRRSKGEGHVGSYQVKGGTRWFWKATLQRPDGSKKAAWKRGYLTKRTAQQ